MTKETFKKNFWEGFSEVLGPKHAIQCLRKCDFTPIYEWHMAERERKRALTKEVGVSGWEVGGGARQGRGGCGWVIQHNHEYCPSIVRRPRRVGHGIWPHLRPAVQSHDCF